MFSRELFLERTLAPFYSSFRGLLRGRASPVWLTHGHFKTDFLYEGVPSKAEVWGHPVTVGQSWGYRVMRILQLSSLP